MDDLTASLLWLGIEDSTGLWDARAEVAQAKPDCRPEDVTKAARALILDLVDQGLIEVRVGDDAVSEDSAIPVRAESLESVMADACGVLAAPASQGRSNPISHGTPGDHTHVRPSAALAS